MISSPGTFNNAMTTAKSNTIFINVAHTSDGDVVEEELVDEVNLSKVEIAELNGKLQAKNKSLTVPDRAWKAPEEMTTSATVFKDCRPT